MYKYNIENMNEWAAHRGGECCSLSYEGIYAKLRWKCKFNHIWETVPKNIKDGCWCPYCATNSLMSNLKEMNRLAKLKNGKCISKKYKGANVKLEWECSSGHRWWSCPNSIQQGYWCRVCSVMNSRLSIQDMHILAAKRGGKCIDEIYKNNKTKLEWECSVGHKWMARPSHIKQGHWCPYCTRNISEEKCRYIFEQLIGRKFTKSKIILKNKQELDGYNKELRIGFEYQGKQHYEKTTRFTDDQFRDIQKLDKKKKSRIYYLKKQGIIRDIIFIKYTQATSDKKLENYIIKRLNKIDLNLIKNNIIEWSKFYQHFSPLNDIKKIIQSYGGRLVCETYVNVDVKITVMCKEGHQFQISPSNLKRGKWCYKCLCCDNRKYRLEELKNILEKRKNQLIDSDYRNSKIKVKIRCDKGHLFKMTPSHIKEGHGCPFCAGNARGSSS